MTTKLGYCLNSVSRLPDEDHVRFCLDNRGQTLAKDRMIFDTQDADLLGVRHNGPPSWRSVTQICSVSQKKRASSEANSANKPERPASQVRADQASQIFFKSHFLFQHYQIAISCDGDRLILSD